MTFCNLSFKSEDSRKMKICIKSIWYIGDCRPWIMSTDLNLNFSESRLSIY